MKSTLDELVKDMNRATHGQYVILMHHGDSVTSQSFSFKKAKVSKDEQGRLPFHNETAGYYITEAHDIEKEGDLDTKKGVVYEIRKDQILLVRVHLYSN